VAAVRFLLPSRLADVGREEAKEEAGGME